MAAGTIRLREHAQREGWLLEYTCVLFACRVCTARLTSFEYAGHAVPEPADADSLTLFTPVGHLRWHRGDEYHPYSIRPQPFDESTEAITDAELIQGYYDVANDWPAKRKCNTPAHWCLGISASRARWLEPGLIDRLAW
jgi:hypothetical protein